MSLIIWKHSGLSKQTLTVGGGSLLSPLSSQLARLYPQSLPDGNTGDTGNYNDPSLGHGEWCGCTIIFMLCIIQWRELKFVYIWV